MFRGGIEMRGHYNPSFIPETAESIAAVIIVTSNRVEEGRANGGPGRLVQKRRRNLAGDSRYRAECCSWSCGRATPLQVRILGSRAQEERRHLRRTGKSSRLLRP